VWSCGREGEGEGEGGGGSRRCHGGPWGPPQGEATAALRTEEPWGTRRSRSSSLVRDRPPEVML